MGLSIPTFEALTLLPPNDETFKCSFVNQGVHSPMRLSLEKLSEIASLHYEADLGYRQRAKSKQLGFRLGRYWFPVTKARVNKMLRKYGSEIAD